VLQWCRDEPEEAQEELAVSAKEVIELMRSVAAAARA
jgi:hypothetical protein